jgi:hypothetical protein
MLRYPILLLLRANQAPDLQLALLLRMTIIYIWYWLCLIYRELSATPDMTSVQSTRVLWVRGRTVMLASCGMVSDVMAMEGQ